MCIAGDGSKPPPYREDVTLRVMAERSTMQNIQLQGTVFTVPQITILYSGVIMSDFSLAIPPYAAIAIEKLNNSGFEACVVGGCVRDTLIGRTPGDWDICTSALPEQTRQVFEKDFHVIDTGIRHGTVTVVSRGQPLEITTYRTEGDYTDHRRPDSVTFVTDIRQDLSRRDFTVNAMAYSKTTGLIDLFGGQKDLQNRVIRCVGDAEKRFEEDALRILRALRFAAVLNFEIEPQTAAAVHKMRGLLENIAVERIFIELKKLLSAPAACRIVSEFADVILAAAGQQPHPHSAAANSSTAVAFCLHFSHAASVLTQLKAPKALITSASALQTAAPPETLFQALGLMGKLGDGDFQSLIEYYDARGISSDLLRQARSSGIPCRISQLDIAGKDLADLGISPGPAMGRTLNALLDAVMRGQLENKKSLLLGAAERFTEV